MVSGSAGSSPEGDLSVWGGEVGFCSWILPAAGSLEEGCFPGTIEAQVSGPEKEVETLILSLSCSPLSTWH